MTQDFGQKYFSTFYLVKTKYGLSVRIPSRWSVLILAVFCGFFALQQGWMYVTNVNGVKKKILSDLSEGLAKKKARFSFTKVAVFQKLMRSLIVSGQFDGCVVRYEFKNGQFLADGSICNPVDTNRMGTLLYFLNKHIAKSLARESRFSFFIHNTDAAGLSERLLTSTNVSEVPFFLTDSTPEFTGLAAKLDLNVWLVPDYYLIAESFSKDVRAFQAASEQHPFKDRSSVAFWRGGQSGGSYDFESKEQIPRFRLVDFSYHHPEVLDARFIAHDIQLSPTLSGLRYRAFMNQRFGPNPRAQFYTPREKHVGYKYLVAMDGNVSAWDRVIFLLNSGSVLIYNTRFEQFVTRHVKENVHYVGFKNDMSDFEAKIQMLEERPEISGRIIANARRLGEQLDFDLFVQYVTVLCLHLASHFEPT